MKKLNVFIFPTDDRSGQASLIYHYASRGHDVFLPKFGTLNLNWNRIATWPALLYKCSENPSVRNLDLHGFVRNDIVFGEDCFLLSYDCGTLYPENVSCSLIDLETSKIQIDAFHTLRGGEAHLQKYFEIANKYFPNAKWISSTFNQMTSTPGSFAVKNAAKLIPAPYESHHNSVNNVCLFSGDFEAKLLNAKIQNNPRNSFASFNHNFANRQPDDFRLFQQMNQILMSSGINPVPNYGGNIRTQGADLRFSGENGLTGNFETISPRNAYELTSKLKAVVHFKEIDWGGGVFYYSLNCETPIITTHRYVVSSNSQQYIIDGVNSICVNSPEEAAEAVIRLNSDDSVVKKLSDGMKSLKERIFTPMYWEKWDAFIENVQ